MLKYACPLWIIVAAANVAFAWAPLMRGDWEAAAVYLALGVAGLFVAALSWKRAHAKGS
jgi:hypothetical protein